MSNVQGRFHRITPATTERGEEGLAEMRIVSLNGFRIPGIEYPRKSYGEFEDLKNPDTEMLYFDAPDNFLHFQEQTYENDLVGVQHARDAWKLGPRIGVVGRSWLTARGSRPAALPGPLIRSGPCLSVHNPSPSSLFSVLWRCWLRAVLLILSPKGFARVGPSTAIYVRFVMEQPGRAELVRHSIRSYRPGPSVRRMWSGSVSDRMAGRPSMEPSTGIPTSRSQTVCSPTGFSLSRADLQLVAAFERAQYGGLDPGIALAQCRAG